MSNRYNKIPPMSLVTQSDNQWNRPVREESVWPLLTGRYKCSPYHLWEQRALCWAAKSFVSIVRGKSRDTKSITVAFAWPDCDLFRPGWLLNIPRRAQGSVCRRCGEWTTLVLTDQQMTLNCFDLNDLLEFPPPYTPTFDSHSSDLMYFLSVEPHIIVSMRWQAE